MGSVLKPTPQALHLCYFGLDEPLVQTQVLPYLRELSRGGAGIALLTFESDPARRWPAEAVRQRRQILAADGIDWHFLPYHRWPSVPAKLYDIANGVRAARRIARARGVTIVHGRGHVGALIGLLARRRLGERLVFDVHDGDLLHRSAKAIERALFRSADGFVVPTEAARQQLFPMGPPRGQPVEVYDLHAVGAACYRRLYDEVARRAAERRVQTLVLASYPIEAASSRYRVNQFIAPLAARGIDIRFEPFLDRRLFEALYRPSHMLAHIPGLALRAIRRVGAFRRSANADVVFVQREAMLFGPPIAEWIAARVLRRPLVLDLDDATYLARRSPLYGRLATALKWPGKTESLIRWSRVVICGSESVAEYVRSRGTAAVVIPTAVDATLFRPASTRNGGAPVIGWIGTHSTYPFFARLIPILEKLAEACRFRVVIVGSGLRDVRVRGVDVEVRTWALEREAEDFRSLDIGVYPLPDDEWSAGKSGLKAALYMMSGVPSVLSPVGVCRTVGAPGQTHLTAQSDDDWLHALTTLVSDAELRSRMGRAARSFAEQHYSIDRSADTLAAVIAAAGRRN